MTDTTDDLPAPVPRWAIAALGAISVVSFAAAFYFEASAFGAIGGLSGTLAVSSWGVWNPLAEAARRADP